MAAQNFASLGLDISGFDETKKQKLNEFISLFDRLSKYDGKLISIGLTPGFVEFNNYIKETSLLLGQVTTKIKELNSATGSISESNSKAASSRRTLTDADREYREEQKRVVEALRALAKEQDKQDNTKRVAQINAEKEATKQLQIQKQQEQKDQKEQDRQSKINQINAEKAALKQLNEQKKQDDIEAKKSIALKEEERKANLLLANSYVNLKRAVKEKEDAYANSVLSSGKNSVASRAAFIDFNATSRQLNDIERNIEKAGGRAKLFGGALSDAFGHIRNLAYILPGLGIAGIFNLAFEAIGKAVEELGLFNDKTFEAIQNQIDFNKEYKEFLSVLKGIEETYRTDLGQIQAEKERVDLLKSQGKSTRDILVAEKDLLNTRQIAIQTEREASGGFARELELRKKLIGATSEYFDAKKAEDDYIPGNQMGRKKPDPRYLELAKSNLERVEAEYEKVKKLNEDYTNGLSLFTQKINEIKAYDEEQRRKLILENIKFETDSIKNKNQIILADEKSTLNEREAALKQIELATIRAAKAQRDYILSKPNARNEDGSLTTESKVAIGQSNETSIEETRKYYSEIDKIQTTFYQRFLKSKSEITKNDLQVEAALAESIFKNEQNSLSDRLEAYKNYVIAKQAIQDVEFLKDIQKGAKGPATFIGPGQKTSLTFEEQQELLSSTNLQKSNIVANSEKQVYDIVYSSLRKQLRAIEDEAKTEEDFSKENYTKQLETLNLLYEKKKISLERYHIERKKIDSKYQKEELDALIVYDEIQLDRLKRFEAQRIDFLIDAAKKRYEATKNGGSKNEQDKAKGELEALEQVKTEVYKDIKIATDKLNSDRLKRAKLGPDEDKSDNKRLLRAIKIGEAILDAAKSVIDAEYEYRASMVEKTKKLMDEQYDHEINAIEKSTLSQKDKFALEVQLQQQKLEKDKEAEAELKKIKHDQAVFDKAISVAKIIASTFASAAGAGFITPAAIAIQIEGAVALAAVLATKIPEYKEGTKGTKHKGGLARTGEGGIPELIIEPYKSPYFVTQDNVSYLPKGTEVIPYKDIPNIREKAIVNNDGWEQTRYLAKQIRKASQKQPTQNNIIINIGQETYKRKILGK